MGEGLRVAGSPALGKLLLPSRMGNINLSLSSASFRAEDREQEDVVRVSIQL